MTEPVVITEETNLENISTPEASVEVMNRLRSDTKFMVNMHERQLERIAQLIEEIAQRVIALEEKVIELDINVRFPDNSVSNEIPSIRGQ